MKQRSTLFTIMAVLLLMVSAVDAQHESRRPGSPVLTNDDVLSPRRSSSLPDEGISRTNPEGSPVRNARAVLEGALTKMARINSMRTRLQTALPTGQREVLIETMKPDRTHIVSADGEMIMIGRKLYMKTTGGWQVTSMPSDGLQSATGFDFRTFVKQMLAKSGVRITGQEVGGQMLDGVDTIAYEFAVSDGAETGKIQLCVGKEDGYIRRMFLFGGSLEFRIWFTNINEPLSIEPPS